MLAPDLEVSSLVVVAFLYSWRFPEEGKPQFAGQIVRTMPAINSILVSGSADGINTTFQGHASTNDRLACSLSSASSAVTTVTDMESIPV